jgi:tRNA dimethylallyltransferase
MHGEVINGDSRQVYRHMDIGTAKPGAAERAIVPHHLYDIVDPDEPFSLARYLARANETLADCWLRAVLPIVVGGSGQYVWALLEGWQVPRVAPDHSLRAELEARAGREGAQSLVDELTRVDPAYAATVDTKNLRRVIRALEVYKRTGQPLSSCRTRTPPDFSWTALGLAFPRDEVYSRIDTRVDAMMGAGLLDEVRGLIERDYPCDLPSMSGIGYRQLCQHLAGELSLTDAVERIKTETHRLARMQSNWFRQNDERIHWLDSRDDTFSQALRVVESGL